MAILSTDYTAFATYANTNASAAAGVLITDTFDSWRKKTNGLIVLLDGATGTGGLSPANLSNGRPYWDSTGAVMIAGGSGGATGPGVNGAVALTVKANTTVDAMRITQAGSGAALYIPDTGSGSPFIVESSGRVIVGHTAPLQFYNRATNTQGLLSPRIGVMGSNTALSPTPSVAIFQSSADVYGGVLAFVKSKGTAGSRAIVTANDSLGIIDWQGYATSSLNITAAAIEAKAEGTVNAAAVPGILTFSTNTGSALTERMRIDSAGNIGIGKTAAIGVKLDVLGAVTASGAIAGDSLKIGSSFMISNAGAISGITSLTLSGTAIGTTGALSGGSLNIGSTFSVSAAGAVTGVTTLGASGAVSCVGLTSTGGIVAGGAVTGVTTLTATGAVSCVGLTSTGGITATGAVTGVTTLAATGVVSCGGLNAGSGGITNAGAVTGVTTLGASGAVSCVGLNAGSGGITATGAVTGVTTLTATGAVTCGGLNAGSGGITNAGPVTGVTTLGASGVVSCGSLTSTGPVSCGGLNAGSGGITNAGAVTGVTTLTATGAVTCGSYLTINRSTVQHEGGQINLEGATGSTHSSGFWPNQTIDSYKNTLRFIDAQGGGTVTFDNGSILTTGQLYIRNNSPTIYMRDIENRSAMLHVNADTFYVLRAPGNDSDIWDGQPYPFQVNLSSGNGTFYGSVSGTGFTVTSSLRYKQNVQPLSNALSLVEKLQGVTFDWKESGLSDIGLIAEQVNEVLPEFVSKDKDGLPAAVDYGKITSVLIEAVKELAAMVKSKN